MGDRIGWGILGTGAVSHSFAAQLVTAPGAVLQGVSSRNAANASAFAKRHGAVRAHADYSELLLDPAINIVYIATPAALHHDHCLQALQAGKAVFCEKPFTMSADLAEAVIRAARERELFCMEAMWMRFNPHLQRLQQLVKGRRLGAIRTLHADIGWAKDDGPTRSRQDGGCLLSYGCYLLSLAWFLLGPPEHHQARVIRNEHGVDVSAGILLDYPGALVTLAASIVATQSNQIEVQAAAGGASVASPFIDARSLRVWGADIPPATAWEKLRARLAGPVLTQSGAGFRGEIEEVMACLRTGKLESDVMPLEESLAIHRCLDAIRAS